jgi:hypothetical protein
LQAFARNPFHGRDTGKAMFLVNSGSVSPKTALRLVSGTGCENCCRQRIRKITWPFLKRWCTYCVHGNTTSSYRLQNDYSIPPSVFEGLPKVTGDLYNRYVGSAYTLDFYLNSDVVEAYNANLSEEEKISSLDDILAKRCAALDSRAAILSRKTHVL